MHLLDHLALVSSSVCFAEIRMSATDPFASLKWIRTSLLVLEFCSVSPQKMPSCLHLADLMTFFFFFNDSDTLRSFLMEEKK